MHQFGEKLHVSYVASNPSTKYIFPFVQIFDFQGLYNFWHTIPIYVFIGLYLSTSLSFKLNINCIMFLILVSTCYCQYIEIQQIFVCLSFILKSCLLVLEMFLYIPQDISHKQSGHVQIGAVLIIPFQSVCLYYLIWPIALARTSNTVLRVVRADILTLFLVLMKKHSIYHY